MNSKPAIILQKVRQIKWLPHQLKATPSKMRWKHWCAWTSFQSCVPGFKGHPLAFRPRMVSQMSWRVFLWADSLSALLNTYIRSLAFTLLRAAFLLCSQVSWLYLCSKIWNVISQQSLDEALLRDVPGTVLLRVGAAATSHHLLHLHLAPTFTTPPSLLGNISTAKVTCCS